MPSLAFVAGIKAGWLASPGHPEQVVIATVLTVLYALLMIRGMRPVARFMSVSFIVVWMGVIALVIIMGFASHAGFIHNWNTSNPAGLSYTGVIAEAGGLGFSVIGRISWAATLYAMVYAFNVYTGFQWTGYFAGEIKNVRRSAVTSIIGGLIAAVIGYWSCVAARLQVLRLQVLRLTRLPGIRPRRQSREPRRSRRTSRRS